MSLDECVLERCIIFLKHHFYAPDSDVKCLPTILLTKSLKVIKTFILTCISQVAMHFFSEFCKQLAQSGNYSDCDENVLIDEDGEKEESDSTALWEDQSSGYSGRHPFVYKERPIMMNIRVSRRIYL